MDETTPSQPANSTAGTPLTPPLLPSTPPPPLSKAPVPPPKRGNAVWILATMVLAGLLGVSLLGNLGSFAKSFGSIGTRSTGRGMHGGLQEVLVQDNGSRNKIVVLDVAGIITGEPWRGDGRSMVDDLEDQLTMAGKDPAVRAVILRIDSPGGEVLASDDIARLVREFQEDHDKPVVASMGGMAASGGYYVAAPCRWIVANELSITGSIGVILHSYNYRGLMNKVGVRPEVFKSGKFKNMMSGDRTEAEILPEEREMLQALIDETFQAFKKVVREGRAAAHKENGSEGRALVENWESYADGRILSGKQAYEYGFVDELGVFDKAVERGLELAGVENADLVGYRRPFEWGNLFGLFGQTESRAVKVDLGFELPKLQAGRLYFLAPSFLR